MSNRAIYLAWQSGAKLTPLERGILVKFASWYNPADPENSIYPSQEYLAWLFTVAETTVRNAIRRLEKRGYIDTVRVGKGANNRYIINEQVIADDEREPWESDRSKAAVTTGQKRRSRPVKSGGPIEDEAVETQSEDFALTIVDASEMDQQRQRSELRVVYEAVHGVPGNEAEAKAHNKFLSMLLAADVTAAEYPGLVHAHVSMWDSQPSLHSVANRVGQYRNYVASGPLQALSPQALIERRNQEAAWQRSPELPVEVASPEQIDAALERLAPGLRKGDRDE